MIKSMTGFGSAVGNWDGRAITVEIKSVNNRFREVMTRMPRICAALEGAIKQQVGNRLERGRVDIWVQIEERDLRKKSFKVDFELATELKIKLDELRERLGMIAPVTLDQLLNLGIMEQEEDNSSQEELGVVLEPLVNQALATLVLMREVEGSHLAQDLNQRLNNLTAANHKVEELSSSAPDVLLAKLQNRLAELGAGVRVEPGRLAQEVALLADRVDISEEVVRLTSHLIKFGQIIASDGSDVTGRRLEFLLQEMVREVNTMGSKTQDLEVTGLILEMKSELEKLREQVQNIE